jgi:ABC-type multidrug transport system fused ATPase/permease subunit
MRDSINKLWPFLKPVRKKQILFLFILMIISSIFEVVSIGSVVPFLGILLSPEQVLNNDIARPILSYFNLVSSDELINVFSSLFIIAALISGFSRFMLLFLQKRIGHGIGSDLSHDVFRKTLYQPYKTFLDMNSSQLIAGISTKISVVTGSVLIPTLQLISSIFVITSILLILLILDPYLSIFTFLTFGLIYSSILFLTRKQIKNNSKKISTSSENLIKVIQESLGGIRDILIDGTQDEYCGIYKKYDSPLRKSKANTEIISGMPKFFIETLGIVLIAIVALNFSKTENGLIDAIPVLGALAIGAQRLLPVIQQVYASITMIKGENDSFNDIINLLNQPLPSYLFNQNQNLNFKDNIEFKDLSFKYDDSSEWIFNNLNFKIRKGSRIGLVGTTGSGKSTFLDLCMGLLFPNKGSILVDGVQINSENFRSWQSNLSHVPQSIFLSDASLTENIAFGVPSEKVDIEKVKRAAKQAQVYDLIESLPAKFNTRVGERGIKFSGGQRQRIGIARALYKDSDFIIFDEATSALDNETEIKVMDSINSLDRNITFLLVAHRLSSLKGCDIIIEIQQGEIKLIENNQIK